MRYKVELEGLGNEVRQVMCISLDLEAFSLVYFTKQKAKIENISCDESSFRVTCVHCV